MRRLGQIKSRNKNNAKSKEGIKRGKEGRYDIQKTMNKMAIVSTSPIVIILNVNGFNSSINRHRLTK